MKYKQHPIVIRPSRKEDIDAILKILENDPEGTRFIAINRGSKRAMLRKDCGSTQNHVVVAEIEKKIIGFARKKDRKNKKISLEEIAVTPLARGLKVATLLLLWYTTEMHTTGIEAKTFAENEAANALMRKLGMHVTRRTPKGHILYWESTITPWKNILITDCHINLCPKSFLDEAKVQGVRSGAAQDFKVENSADYVLTAMDRVGIRSAIVFPFPFRGLDINRANEYILNIARSHPSRFVPVGLLGPSVKEWIRAGIRGFKENSYYMDTSRETYLEQYKVLADEGLPLLLHPHMKNKADRILFTLEHIPSLKIVLCHSGRKKVFTGEEVLSVARKLVDCGSVFFETSTVWDASVLQELIKLVGSRRVLFGSDHPFGWVEGTEDRVIERELAFIGNIGLNVETANMVLGENTRELFRLPNPQNKIAKSYPL